MNVLSEVEEFYRDFPGEKGIVGKSVNGKSVYYFKVKKTAYPKVIFQYAMHAREYITAYLALKMIKRFSVCGKTGTVYFIPLVNPDGVKICLENNPLYKANGRGVDLNVNFDAGWGTGKRNVRFRGAENFIGEFPFSEPETAALKNFTLAVKPDATVSYHSKGEEIYWEFGQTGKRAARDLAFAKAVASVTGYAVKSAAGSAGGYKDWCVEKLGIPALTLEVGSDALSHPVKKRYLKGIFMKNKKVTETVIEFLSERLWI